MKIAICDDREDDRSVLKALLEAYGKDFEIREYGSGRDLCEDMDFMRECGIVFLDINMDGGVLGSGGGMHGVGLMNVKAVVLI
ncbi:MAG: hypothetical protein IJ733_10455 [Lachnospiraceae bacterium]|nr:hypothetical protein [Lachnospiraceae bacterium]